MHLPWLILAAAPLCMSLTLQRSIVPAALLPRDGYEELETKNTCRWTRCEYGCGAGFEKVIREGGYPGEVMTDHSDEAEVGTLNVGCKTAHQSACCTLTPSVAAYGQCKWSGSAPLCSADPTSSKPSRAACPDSHPHFIFASSAGFGGEKPCDTGAKSYCCKTEVKPWTNCAWYDKETDAFSHGICEASCPLDSILLGMQKGKCEKGESAYCCGGPASLPPPPPPPPVESPKVREFEDAVRVWVDIELDGGPQPSNVVPIKDDESTEDAESEPESESEVNTAGEMPRMMRCARWKQIRPVLTSIITIKASQWSPDQKLMASFWDGLAAVRHPGTSIANLSEWLAQNPIISPGALVDLILYDFDIWASIKKSIKKTRTDVCILINVGWGTGKTSLLQPDIAATTDQNLSTPIERRWISPDIQYDVDDWRSMEDEHSHHYVPWLGTILHGIRGGSLSLHYARWEWYNGNAEFPGGPMLELAYWIGPVPGGWTPQTEHEHQLWRYRDMTRPRRYDAGERDRWVVIHLHFRNEAFLADFDGHTYAGYSAMTMFHAHRAVVDADGLGWRVDGGGGGPSGGRDSRNRRTILSCPGDPEYRDGYRSGNRMHIGDQPSSLHANPSSDLSELFKFHEHLYVQGYVNAPGLMPLIDNQALGHQFNRFGELEALPYRWIQSNREARRPGNDIWIGTNFRIPDYWYAHMATGNLQFDYNIPMPLPLPQIPEHPWQYNPLPAGYPALEPYTTAAHLSGPIRSTLTASPRLRNTTKPFEPILQTRSMNTTSLIHAIQKNWSLPPSSPPVSILPSSLLSSIPIIRLPPALLTALHTLSILTPGQRDRAHSLLNTYFQARIREGSYGGKNRSMVAILEVCDVEKACDSARRMSRGREMQGCVAAGTDSMEGGLGRRGSGIRVRGTWVDNEEGGDGFFAEEVLEEQCMDVDMQDDIAARDSVLIAAPFGALLGDGSQVGRLFERHDGNGGGYKEGDCVTLPPLTPHTEKRRVHLPPIQTSQINTPKAPAANAVQSSFTPLFNSLKEEMGGDLDMVDQEQPLLRSSPTALPHQKAFLQQQQQQKQQQIDLSESTRQNTRFNTTGSAATDHCLLAAQQRATHEFNLCRLHLQETMRQFEHARWRCEGARRRMEGLRERARGTSVGMGKW
ncbi:glycosylhydrolase family 18-9 [Stemphylium lycopersici]|uniref:Glycosylhydrolase family 18-9 n=1 Tax=Stemphylium lycopersici TaxID=183478 RepID=A0A364N5R0_STELY|nr:glycosylhydrolase family 18-9 [Stemphylium lycopersici]